MFASDMVSGFFLLCFLVGLIFSVASFLMGNLQLGGHHGHGGDANGHGAHLGHAHAVGHAHGPVGHAHTILEHAHGAHSVGHGAHPAGAEGGDLPDTRPSPSAFNLSTIMAFLVCFGGVGYIVHAMWGAALVVASIAGGIAGLLGATVIFVFLTRVLLRDQSYLDASSPQRAGAVGKVTVAVPASGVGEVVYPWRGGRRSDGARSASGSPIPRGTEVAIVGYERGIALVEPFADYLERSSALARGVGAGAHAGGE